MISFGHGNIQLRSILDDYLDLMFEWRNDYRIRRYCRQYDLLTRSEHDAWFKELNRNKDKMYAVTIDQPDYLQLIGICGLTNFDAHNRNAEFSLYINPDLHGLGHGTNSLKTLFDHGFKNLGLHRIWGEVYDFNPARGIFESIGMRQEGINREAYFREGKYIDSIIYGVLDREWLSSQN